MILCVQRRVRQCVHCLVCVHTIEFITLRTDGDELLLGSGIDSLSWLPEETRSLIGARAGASGAFKYTAVGQSKSTVSLFLMLVRLSSKPEDSCTSPLLLVPAALYYLYQPPSTTSTSRPLQCIPWGSQRCCAPLPRITPAALAPIREPLGPGRPFCRSARAGSCCPCRAPKIPPKTWLN